MSRDGHSVLRLAAVIAAVIALAALTATAAVHPFRDRVAPHAVKEHPIYVGTADDEIIVNGDRSTNLECWIYDSNGRLTSSDTRHQSGCELRTPGTGMHRLFIRNLGDSPNLYKVIQR